MSSQHSLVFTGRGLCILVGIHRDDTRKELDYMVRKILNLRLFEDPDPKEGSKRWNKSAKDLKLELLCISQFTLYHTLKGNKPDFHLVTILSNLFKCHYNTKRVKILD